MWLLCVPIQTLSFDRDKSQPFYIYSAGVSVSHAQECGKPPMGTRIVGGEPATDGSWPWQVDIQVGITTGLLDQVGITTGLLDQVGITTG